MKRYNVFFSDPTWEALGRLAKQWDVSVSETMRRLLDGAMGLESRLQTEIELRAEAEETTLAKLRNDQIRMKIEASKLAHQVMTLGLDLTTLAEAEAPRREAWEQLKTTVDTLHHDMQAHIDRSESLFRQTAETIAGLGAGLQDARQAITTLYNSIKQIGMLDVDVLRRLSALETGVIDDQAQEARQRGEAWLTTLEADVLARTSGETERDAG